MLSSVCGTGLVWESLIYHLAHLSINVLMFVK